MVFLPELAEYVQAPGISLSDQAKDGREIVRKDNETEPTAVDRPRSLEDLIVLLNNKIGTIWEIGRNGTWVSPRSAFIDLQKLLGDVL